MMLNEYSEWLYSSAFTDPDGNYIPFYHKLLDCLNAIPFQYIIPMDSNRECDGIGLRYIFGYEMGYTESEVARNIDIYPCSVLEMMLGLCRRMETDIMGCDPDYGNRTYIWFSSMLESLGIEYMDDDHFDEEVVEDIVSKCLHRQFKRNGAGSFFMIPKTTHDLRNVEIWYQAMWWLNDYVGDSI